MNVEKCFPVWILEYKSSNFEQSLFLVWYTDIDEIDKLLTNKQNQILVFDTCDEEVVKTYFKWINSPIIVEKEGVIDIDDIKKNIELDNLDDNTIETLCDFINLFGDFVYQNSENKLLEKYIKDEYIDTTWRYFYNYIFFPRFNNKNEYEKWNKPKLEINNQFLLSSIILLVTTFENTFDIIKQ